ncbi:DUF6400 family protein [Streptomyces sp. NPDC058625]|uniref:DUF6400 family protein n=1 Tax=Streptomyces sp. NPDC058625 TaxID=3346564 RepID=UPI0036626CEB
MDQPDAPGPLFPFTIDLTAGEARRRAEVVAALGADWDPVAVLEGEDAATALLYSDLDPAQRRTYDMLAAAGVLPATVREPWDAAAPRPPGGPGAPGLARLPGLLRRPRPRRLRRPAQLPHPLAAPHTQRGPARPPTGLSSRDASGIAGVNRSSRRYR